MIVPYYCWKYVACCGRVRTMKELVVVNLESFFVFFSFCVKPAYTYRNNDYCCTVKGSLFKHRIWKSKTESSKCRYVMLVIQSTLLTSQSRMTHKSHSEVYRLPLGLVSLYLYDIWKQEINISSA